MTVYIIHIYLYLFAVNNASKAPYILLITYLTIRLPRVLNVTDSRGSYLCAV